MVNLESDTNCHTFSHFDYCLDPRRISIPFSQHSIPRWSLFIFFVIFLWTLLFLVSGPLLRSFEIRDGSDVRRRELKFASWTCFFLIIGWIWLSTVTAQPNPYADAARIAIIILVIPLILFIEGVGFALLELRSKDIQRNADLLHIQTSTILHRFTEGIEPYMRAREWCLATLIILLTTFVDFDRYQVPFFGSFGGAIARILMTSALATVAVVWVAQSPGKELGRTSPVGFLRIRGFPGLVDRIVSSLQEWARRSCINYPSDISVGIARKLFNIPEEAPLPPGGALVFTELVRRYGYADCDVNETYVIEDDGRCNFEQTELVYVEPTLLTYRRKFISPVAFQEKPDVAYKAYIVPSLRSNIEKDLEVWKKRIEGAVPVEEWKFLHVVRWNDDQLRTTVIIDITWDLKDVQIDVGSALLFKVQTKGKMSAGTFNGPGNPGNDYWSRTLAKPCHKAKTVIRLSTNSGAGHITKRKLLVLQDDRVQEPESRLFEVTQETRVSSEGRSLTIDLLYGLPGLIYRAEWELKTGALMQPPETVLVRSTLTHDTSPTTSLAQPTEGIPEEPNSQAETEEGYS